MHRSKNTKMSLTYCKLLIRAFFLCILLLGNTFIFISTRTPNQVFAQNPLQGNLQPVTTRQPLTAVSVNKGLPPKRSPALLASPVDLRIDINVHGGPTFQTDRALVYDLNITNISSTTTLDATSGIIAINIIPPGLNSIAVVGNGWSTSLTSANGPATMEAIYTGSPVAPGAAFAPIEIFGILTNNAVPVFTSTAGVFDNNNPNTQLSTFSVSVNQSTQTPSITPTTTATQTPSITPTATPLPTSTAAVTPTSTTTPTATVVSTSTPTLTPDIRVLNQTSYGDTFKVGDQVTFVIVVENEYDSVNLNTPITVSDVLPSGLSNLSAVGFFWSIKFTNTSSPTTFNATLTPTTSIRPGDTLPFLFITGKLTHDALDPGVPTGVFTHTAKAMVQGIEAEQTTSIFVEELQSSNYESSRTFEKVRKTRGLRWKDSPPNPHAEGSLPSALPPVSTTASLVERGFRISRKSGKTHNS